MSSATQHHIRIHLLAAATALAVAGVAAPVFAGEVFTGNLKSQGEVTQFIVKYKKGSAPSTNAAALASSLDQVAAQVSAPVSAQGRKWGLRQVRQLPFAGGRVVASDARLSHGEALAVMKRIAADRNVEYVQVNGSGRLLLTPNDPSFAQQWHYADNAVGIRAPTAWNTSNGAGVVIAVIDSGIVSHTDLNANVLPGYDFISTTTGASSAECGRFGLSAGCGRSNDGDGRDPNPNDDAGSTAYYHGTHVGGTIAALTNNRLGVAGIAYGAKIVPIRAAGMNGYNSDADTIDAIVWASGGQVAGVPANPNPAEIINLSLGDDVPCSQTPAMQAAVNTAIANGSVVVAAAGNSNIDVARSQPAGCNGVISVAASNRSGSRTAYSSWGASIDVTAPGGDSGGAVLSTINNNRYGPMSGTSMASPHAAAVAALIVAASPTTRTPAQVEQILESTARPIPASRCRGGCGAGLIDAAAAVQAARR